LPLTFVVPLVLLTATCASDAPTAPDPGVAAAPNVQSTSNFTIYAYDGLAQEIVDAIAARLEEERPRIIGDLRVPSMPRARVDVWANRESFYQAMLAAVGTIYEGATGYVLGPTVLRLLAVGDAPQTAVHEFVHIVTLNINASIANNPRWLWEAVAVYEAEEFNDPQTVSFMAPGDFPTIEELDAPYDHGGWIYQAGYVLIEYIVEAWGMDAVIALIESNGDIPSVLGVSVTELEVRWHAWLEGRYF
jgi:hypothetical protein